MRPLRLNLNKNLILPSGDFTFIVDCVIINTKESIMKSGTYYIGDLCYVMHDEWDEYCALTIVGPVGNRVADGEFTLKDGRKFASYTTAYGDGTYYASNGASLGVDSGLIGCILMSDIDQTNCENDVSLGTVVEYTNDFVTYGGRNSDAWDGVIHFGDITVHTDADEEYDDEENYDE